MWTRMCVTIGNMRADVCRWHRGKDTSPIHLCCVCQLSRVWDGSWCNCVCVHAAATARKESLPAYGLHWLKDRKEESKKSKAWKSSKREGLFWCVFAFLSMLVKEELLNGSEGEEHLKLNEALRKTHTRSHNKSPVCLRKEGVEVELTARGGEEKMKQTNSL